MSEPQPAARPSRVPPLVRAIRPKQWIKNVLVFTAPLAAGVLLRTDVARASVLALVAFCLVSASIYLINDVRDAEADRQHPKKRLRPIAAGELRPGTALAWAAVCLVAAVAIAWMTTLSLVAVIAVYWLAQVGYSLLWKNEPIIDLFMVALGFLLRAVAGGVASQLPLSQWFLLVASFGSLFMVAGKRYSEMVQLGPDAGTRASLREYTDTYLRFVWAVSAALVIACYSLWAFETSRVSAPRLWAVPWSQLSIAPFTLAMLRYAYRIDRGDAGEPEDVVLGDRMLQLMGVLWVVPVALSVFF